MPSQIENKQETFFHEDPNEKKVHYWKECQKRKNKPALSETKKDVRNNLILDKNKQNKEKKETFASPHSTLT